MGKQVFHAVINLFWAITKRWKTYVYTRYYSIIIHKWSQSDHANYLDTVLIGLTFFAPTPAPFSPNWLFPRIRPIVPVFLCFSLWPTFQSNTLCLKVFIPVRFLFVIRYYETPFHCLSSLITLILTKLNRLFSSSRRFHYFDVSVKLKKSTFSSCQNVCVYCCKTLLLISLQSSWHILCFVPKYISTNLSFLISNVFFLF